MYPPLAAVRHADTWLSIRQYHSPAQRRQPTLSCTGRRPVMSLWAEWSLCKVRAPLVVAEEVA